MNQDFGSHIRRIRSQEEMTVRDLARLSGIPESEIVRIEEGAIIASREQTMLLAAHLNIDEREVFQLHQLTKISVEQENSIGNSGAPKLRSSLFRHSRLASQRLSNLNDDLSLLERSSVTVKMHVPTAPLRPFIENILYCKGHNLGRRYETAIPDGTAQLQIAVGEGGRKVIHPLTRHLLEFRRAWVMGIHSTPVTFQLSDIEAIVYVRFRPAGLYAFTKMDQELLNNEVADATVLFGSPISDLWAELSEATSPEDIFNSVENFFLEKLMYISPTPSQVEFMLDHIDAPLRKIAEATGYSAKYLTNTFQKHIGIGPKNFQRIIRFNKSMRYLSQLTDKVDWAHIVHERGYHDQAHFIKEFKEFTGFSPLNYLAMGQACIHYFHSNICPDLLIGKEN